MLVVSDCSGFLLLQQDWTR